MPSTFREQIDLGAISIMSKPRTDTEDVLPLCYRCSELNPLFEEGCVLFAPVSSSTLPFSVAHILWEWHTFLPK